MVRKPRDPEVTRRLREVDQYVQGSNIINGRPIDAQRIQRANQSDKKEREKKAE